MNPLAEIEGLLFISGDEGISLGDLAKVTGYLKPAILEMIAQLKEKYQQDENCALTLLDSDSVYRLATKAQLADVMQHYFEEPLTTPLTQTLLEVLAIVAYKQPLRLTRSVACRALVRCRNLRLAAWLRRMVGWQFRDDRFYTLRRRPFWTTLG